MELHALLLSILLLSILRGSDAKSLDQPLSCVKQCKSEGNFAFSSDYKYVYEYNVNSVSSFNKVSSRDRRAETAIQANVIIQPISPCELVLDIQDIRFDNSRPRTREEREWVNAVRKHQLVFSWQEGRIEDICTQTTNDDPTWVMNFKRGILSTLQVSSHKNASAVKEVDVSGDCESAYEVATNERTGEVTKIVKRKDYSKCVDRDNYLLFSYFTAYESQTPRQNFIYSNQKCTQTFSYGSLNSVDCVEEHVFRPFSTEDSGAQTEITQSLRLQSARRSYSSIYDNSFTERCSLIFEEEPESVMQNEAERKRSTAELLGSICNEMSEENYDSIGKKFISLVFALRQLSYESLVEIYNGLEECSRWETSIHDMFTDALPFCGSEGCVEFAVRLISNNEVDETIAGRWISGFNFIQNPTAKILNSLMDVVESGKYPEAILLTTGSIIHRICSGSESDCLNNQHIRQSLLTLESNLGTNCHSPSPEGKKNILLTLRALGNAGRSTSVSTLANCISNEDNDMEIRIAAVEAFRRMPCNIDRSILLDSMYDKTEDSELRIFSYMGLMQCPTSQVIQNVKSLLESEENMQVGSYIWSHLKQIMESSDPLKHYIQVMLSNVAFKEFDLDPRKYSQNYEGSISSDTLNAGATAEGNLVWSSKSFIPRSATVNLTVDLFGQAVNLFEIGGRFQGLENILQSYLEPKMFEKKENLPEADLSFDPELDQIHREYKLPRNDDVAKASWYLRVLGNEVMYGNTDTLKSTIQRNRNNIISEFASNFMSRNGFNYHDDTMLLNSRHVLPTGLGFPLEIAFNGSTSIDVYAKGSLDFNPLTPGFGISGKFMPRATVVISGSMTMNNHVRKIGIATESTATTSANVDGFVKTDGSSFSFELDSPFQRNVAFEFKHTLLTVQDNAMQAIAPSNLYLLNEIESCTGEYLGQKLCFTQTVGNARDSLVFPEDGPLQFSIYSQKTDPTLMKYVLSGEKRTKYNSPEDTWPSKLGVTLGFDTPGSTENRKLQLQFNYDLSEKRFFGSVLKDGRVNSVQGSYSNEEKQKTVNLNADWFGRNVAVNAKYAKETLEDETTWTIDTDATIDEKVIEGKALLALQPGKSLKFDFDLDNVLPSPINVAFNLEDKQQRKRGKLSYAGNGIFKILPYANTGFDFSVNLKPKLNNLMLELNYKVGKGQQNSVHLLHRRQNRSTKTDTEWDIEHSLASTQFPSLDHKLNVGYQSRTGYSKTNVLIQYGQDQNELDNPYLLRFSEEFNDLSSDVETKYNLKSSLFVPYMKVDHGFAITHMNNLAVLDTSVQMWFSSDTTYDFKFMKVDNAPNSDLLDRQLEIQVPTPWGVFRFTDAVVETQPNIYKSNSVLGLGEANHLSFNCKTNIRNLPTQKYLDVALKRYNDSDVFVLTSDNRITSNVYSSTNVINLVGYQPMKLSLSHENLDSNGFTSNLHYQVAPSDVRVQLAYSRSETKKEVELSLLQSDVQERNIVATVGWERSDNNTNSVYGKMLKNNNVLFNSVIGLTRNPDKQFSGKVSVEFQENMSSAPVHVMTEIDTDIEDGMKVSFKELNNRLNAEFTSQVDRSQWKLFGQYEQNFIDGFANGQYEIKLGKEMSTAFLSSRRSRANFKVMYSSDALQASYDHNLREMQNLNIPSNGEISLTRSSSKKNKQQAEFIATYGRQSLKSNFVFSRQNRQSSQTSLELSMTNDLFDMLPQKSEYSMTWTSEEDLTSMSFDVQYNDENLHGSISVQPRSSISVDFSQNLLLLQYTRVPKKVMARGAVTTEPKGIEIDFVCDTKTVNLKSNASPSEINFTFRSNGISELPKYMVVNLQGSANANKGNLVGTIRKDSEVYSVTTTYTYSTQEKSRNSLVPFIKKLYKLAYDFELTRNGQKYSIDSEYDVNNNYIKYSYHMTQNLLFAGTTENDYPESVSQECTLNFADHQYEYNEVVKAHSKAISKTLRIRPESDEPFYYHYETSGPSLSSIMKITYYLDGNDKRSTFKMGFRHQQEYLNLSINLPTMQRKQFEFAFTNGLDSVDWLPKSTTVEGTYSDSDSYNAQMSYTYGSESGKVSVGSNLDMNDMQATVRIPRLLNNDISVQINYKVTETGLELTVTCNCGGHKLSLYSDCTFTTNFLADYKSGVSLPKFSTSFDFDVNIDDEILQSFNKIDLSEEYLLINTTNKQSLTTKLPPSFVFVKKFEWNLSKGGVSLKITDNEEAPFVLNMQYGVVGTSSATFSLQHNGNQLSEFIPQNLVIKASRESNNNDHTFDLSVNADDKTEHTNLQLSYSKSMLNLVLKNNIELFFGIPENMEITFDYSKSATNLHMLVELPDRTRSPPQIVIQMSPLMTFWNWMDTLPRTIKYDGSAAYTSSSFSGTFEMVLDRKIYGTTLKLASDEEESTLHLSVKMPGQEQLQITLSKSVGNWILHHNIESFGDIPRFVKMNLLPDENANGVSITIPSGRWQIAMNKNATENGILSITMNHNINFITSKLAIPEQIEFTIKSQPNPSLNIIWGEKHLNVLKKTQVNSCVIHMSQSFISEIPAEFEVGTQWDLSEPKKTVQLTYKMEAVNFESSLEYQYTEQLKEFTFTGDLTKDGPLVHAELGVRQSGNSGSMDLLFKQYLTDLVTHYLQLHETLTLTKNGGSGTATFSTGTPVTMTVDFARLAQGEFTATFTHDQDSIAEAIPKKMDFEVSYTATRAKGKFMFTVKGVDSELFSAKHTYIMNEGKSDLSFQMSNTMDILERELSIPKEVQATFSLSLHGMDLKYQVDDKSLEFESGYDSDKEEFHISMEQNMFERVWDTKIPSYGLIELKKNRDSGYKFTGLTKNGRKRRYVIVGHDMQRDSETLQWKMKVSQNIYRGKFPYVTSIDLDISKFQQDIQFSYNDKRYHMTHTRPSDASYYGGTISFSHNDDNLDSVGIPQNNEGNVKIYLNEDSIVITGMLDADSAHSEFSMTHEKAQNNLIISIKTNAFDRPISLTMTFSCRHGDSSCQMLFDGTQAGLENVLPAKFSGSVTLSFGNSYYGIREEHNIPLLKTVTGIPHLTNAYVSFSLDSSSHQYSGKLYSKVDDIFYAYHFGTIEMTKSREGTIVTFQGEVTNGLWATSDAEQVPFNGKFNMNIDRRNFKFDLTFGKETDNSLSHITISNAQANGYHEWVYDAPIPLFEKIGLPSSIRSTFNYDGRVIRYHYRTVLNSVPYVADVQITLGNAFEFDLSTTYGQLNLSFDKNRQDILDFTHNMETLEKYLPTKVAFSMSKNKREMEAKLITSQGEFSATLTSNSLVIKLSQIMTLNINYMTHPSYKVNGYIQISPINVYYTLDSEIQFFMKKNGKSFCKIKLIDQVTSRQLQVYAHALLQDRNILNLDINLAVTSTFPAIPDFVVGYTSLVTETSFSYEITGKVGQYATTMHINRRDFNIEISLPRKYPVYQFALTGDCDGSVSEKMQANLAMKWNDLKSFEVKTMILARPGRHVVNITVLNKKTGLGFTYKSFEYSYQKNGNAFNSVVTIARDGERMKMSSVYTRELSSSTTEHNLVVKIQQPFSFTYIPKEFTTTGTVKYNKFLYDSDWKITSEGNELVTLRKLFKHTDNKCTMDILWKQPYREFPLTFLSIKFLKTYSPTSMNYEGSIEYNSEPTMKVVYNWETENEGRSGKSDMLISSGYQEWSSDWSYEYVERNPTGKRLIIQYSNKMPSYFGLPTSNSMKVKTFWRGKSFQITGEYGNSFLEDPLQMVIMALWQSGETLINTKATVSMDDSIIFDSSFSFNTTKSVSFFMKLPPLNIDTTLSGKYNTDRNTFVIKIVSNGQQPIVIRGSLQEIINRLQEIWNMLKAGSVIPNIKLIKDFVRNANINDAYIGLMINETPFTIHFVTGIEVHKVFMSIVTKKNFEVIDELLKVTASIVDSQTIQLNIQAHKRLSYFGIMALNSFTNELNEKIDVTAEMLINCIDAMKSMVEGSEQVQMTVNENIEYMKSTIRLVQSNLKTTVKDVGENGNNMMVAHDNSLETTVRNTIQAITSIVSRIQSIINQPIEKLKQDYLNKVAEELIGIVQPVLHLVSVQLRRVHAGELFIELVQEGITDFIFFVDKNMGALLNAAKKPMAELISVNENEVIINIPLTLDVKDVVAPPSVKEVTLWILKSKLAFEIDAKLKLLYKLVDNYYRYRSILYMPMDELLPPFKGHAELSSFTHFNSFDGKRFDYSSSCESTHILAHDFKNAEFTVKLTYGRIPVLTILTRDNRGQPQGVMIKKDYSVTDMGGETLLLPTDYDNMAVTRTGDVVTVKTTLGLTVSCNFRTDFCSLDVSAFYFGTTGGLLGTFNNELSDEFNSRGSVPASDTDEFMTSWMVGRKCDTSNTATECRQKSNLLCLRLFEDSQSVFRSCFPVVDPKPFMEMCLQDTCYEENKMKTCSAASSYIHRCQLLGSRLPMPDHCVMCEAVSGDAFNSQSQVPVTGADVVFVVEKSSCMRFKRKDYKKLLSNLHNELTSGPASRNIKYAVVGFGGPQQLQDPHTVTIMGDLFAEATGRLSQDKERQITNALKRGKNGDSEPDALAAIHYAAQLPFRAGASRTIILLTCGECTQSSNVNVKSVTALLQKQGIVLHHLLQKNILVGRSSKKVYGFNQESAFIKNSDDNMDRRNVKISSHDQCVSLVDYTGGSIWNSNMINRDSLRIITNEIRTGVNAVSQQSCQCSVSENNSPTAMCSAA